MTIWFTIGWLGSTLAGFPHSEICGSKRICHSPQLIAACHVLRRLLMPRHSPCALHSLTFSLVFFSRITWVKVCEIVVYPLCTFRTVFGKTLISSSVTLLRIVQFSRHNREFIVRCANFVFAFFCTAIDSAMLPSFWALVEMRRVELLTPCLQGRCSPNWATPPCGGLKWARTTDLTLIRRVL